MPLTILPGHRLLAIAITLSLTTTATATATAQVLEAVGKVISVRPPGAAKLVSAQGGEKTAHYADLLYPGDRFEFTTNGRVETTIRGRETPFVAGAKDLTVPAGLRGFFAPQEERYVQGLVRFLGQPRRAIISFPYARGDDPAERPAAAALALAPTGVQYVLNDTRQVGLVWANRPQTLIVTGAGQPRTVSASDQAWVLIQAPDAAEWSVASEDGRLQWTIKVASAAPRPPWAASDTTLSDPQRVVRAIWILREGPPTWRLFALGELAELSVNKNFVASQTWTAARSGEWTEWEKVLSASQP